MGSDIFEDDGLGPPKAKGFIMFTREFNYGDINAGVWFTVIGMHQYQTPSGPSTPERLDFTGFDTSRNLNIFAESGATGTIYFLLRITYKVLDRGSGLAGPTLSLGLANYRCTFDYAFDEDDGDGLDAKSLIIEPTAVQTKEPYQDHEMADEYIELGTFNPSMGLTSGPRFVRISPALILPGVSASTTQSMQVGMGDKVKVQGTLQGGATVSTPQSPNSVGSFTISIRVIAKPAEAPPKDFEDEMALRLFYHDEKEVEFTRAKKQAVLDWVTRINRKYPQLAEAVRAGGGPLLHVDGFASITGTPIGNQQYGDWRVSPVKQFVAAQLAVPASHISPKSFGSQLAIWEWDFDTAGNAKKGPRAGDRMVKIWFDVDAAWRIVKKGKVPKTAAPPPGVPA